MSIEDEVKTMQHDLDTAPDKSIEQFAQMFANEHGHEARYIPTWDSWMVWDGMRWKKDEKLVTFSWAREICKREARKAHNDPRLARSIATPTTCTAVLKFAGCDQAIVMGHDEWDSDL
jgi:hypothetical protein